MAAAVVVYKTPKNVAAFNDYYFAKHVPIAKKLPGLRSYLVSDGAVGLPFEPAGSISSRPSSSTASRRLRWRSHRRRGRRRSQTSATSPTAESI